MEKIVVTLLFSLLTIGSLQAATIVSVQAGAWDDPTTWDCACVPLASWPGDDITIAHAVTYDADIIFNYYQSNSLTINSGASLTMTAGSLTMDAPAFFTFNGTLDIQNGNLNITSGGTKSAGNASFTLGSTGSVEVSGDFKSLQSGIVMDISGNFDIGGDFETQGSGGTVNITATATVSLGSYTQNAGSASSFNIADGGQVEVVGDVTVANSGGTDFDINGDMNVGGSLAIGSGSSVTVNDGSLTVVIGIDTTGGGTIDTTGSGTVATPSCTAPCDADVTIDTTLPVTLLSFDAFSEGSNVILSWSTETELNNAHFSIEKSLDQITFNKLVDIEGNGNSTILRNYQWVDESPSSVAYYRLSQTDFDGTYTALGTLRVTNESAESQLVFYPNPVNQSSPIFLKSDREELWSIYSSTGKLLMTGKSKTIQLNLPGGAYFLKGGNGIQRLIVN